MGDWFVSVLCLNHKVELAIHDTFKISINETAEKQLIDVYYLFKRANLKWRLFKQFGTFSGLKYKRYKRPFGTRWVSHQSLAVDVCLFNFSVLFGYLNEQILNPYNLTMRKEKSRLEGIRNQMSNLKVFLFNFIKMDILEVIKPLSLTLEKINLIVPEAITIIESVFLKLDKLEEALAEESGSLDLLTSFFPRLNSDLPDLKEAQSESLERSNRAGSLQESSVFYNGYIMSGGSVEEILKQLKNEVYIIVNNLKSFMADRMKCILDDPVFTNAAIVLDTSAYASTPLKEIISVVTFLSKHFKHLLHENGFQPISLGKQYILLNDKKYKRNNLR